MHCWDSHSRQEVFEAPVGSSQRKAAHWVGTLKQVECDVFLRFRDLKGLMRGFEFLFLQDSQENPRM